MTTFTSSVATTPRRPVLSRDVAMRLALDEYDRALRVLQSLAPDDWSKPTVCAGWDVHDLAGHLLGMAEFAASLPEQLRQLLAARRAGGVFIDALTSLQVGKHHHDTPDQLVRAFAVTGPKAARGRRRTPALVRRRRMPVPQTVDGVDEDWTIGFLVDVILTRDTWMHRLDLCEAVGCVPSLTQEHDGAIVDDIVREWAERHGHSCRVHLAGPAGGSWTFGGGGPVVELDAPTFCRLVSGRGEAVGLLAQQVPF
jgi:uncharacterized protein (TIGR03083 family)